MKNSIYNKKEVPAMQICSQAENYLYDDVDNPLGEFDIIPEGKKDTVLVKTVENYVSDGENYEDVHYSLSTGIENLSDVLEEPNVKVIVPFGVHPFAYLKEIGVDFTKSWVFMHEEVVDTLRKLPYKHHLDTVAYGEFFRFEDYDTMSLQKVEYFPKWKVILEGKLSTEEFYRPESPEAIIEVVMK